ncbi:MAG: sensor histidine kinase [Chloroflexi bacterium]|nr:sensor histidine kinase [Chloroflexota bacterium]
MSSFPRNEYSRGELLGKRIMQAVAVLWLGMLYAPVQELTRTSAGMAVAGAVGVVGFLAIYLWIWLRAFAQTNRDLDALRQWIPPVALLLLSIVLNLVYGPDWYPFFIFVGVGASITLPTWTAIVYIAGTIVVAALVGVAQHTSLQGIGLSALTVGSVGAGTLMVSYVLHTARELRTTRAELAQMAVANERLRFARDLHDLLGHSLSLIALKADLVEQLIARKPEQAVQEVRDVQRVTRAALKEVREAVVGYREQTLAAELVSAREMLAAAGIGYHLDGDPAALPPIADATLAWVLREAITNVIRHSQARRCVVRLVPDATGVRLEVIDDGAGLGSNAKHAAGSGLAGLTERVTAAGGSCHAGPGAEGGFQVIAWVPLAGAPQEIQGR